MICGQYFTLLAVYILVIWVPGVSLWWSNPGLCSWLKTIKYWHLFQKRNAWISSSFGGFGENLVSQGKPKKSKQLQGSLDSSFSAGKWMVSSCNQSPYHCMLAELFLTRVISLLVTFTLLIEQVTASLFRERSEKRKIFGWTSIGQNQRYSRFIPITPYDLLYTCMYMYREKSGFVQSLEFLKNSWNVPSNFPDLEKVWKTKMKSWKNGKRSSVFFFFESYNMCFISEIFFDWSNLIQS